MELRKTADGETFIIELKEKKSSTGNQLKKTYILSNWCVWLINFSSITFYYNRDFARYRIGIFLCPFYIWSDGKATCKMSKLY